MGIPGQLRRVENQLIRDLEGTTVPLWSLGKRYGVTKQAISLFVRRKGIKRPKRDHIEKCSICRGLIRISKKPYSDFMSSQTIKEKLRIKAPNWSYHLRILRKHGLISQKFGRLHSKKAQQAYQIYFKKRLPVGVIGRRVGLKNFPSVIKQHKVLGWEIPDRALTNDENDRRRTRPKTNKRKRKG